MSTKTYANPSTYWEERLRNHFDLTGVGYGALGPSYNQTMYEVRLRTLDRALHITGGPITGQHVLEIGCGVGFYTEMCRRQAVASYTGVDITAVSVQTLSHKYPEYVFLQADIGDSAFPVRDQFDVILIADVLFHIVDDARFQNAIANLAGCLRPAGRLILSDVLSVNTRLLASHFQSRALSDYEQSFGRQGLAVRHIEPIFALLQPPASIPGTSSLWRFYAALWRYGLMRIARWRWFDRGVPPVLKQLDERFFLKRAGVGTPNSKWVVAMKQS
jgi:SAM-dependent methyltransferase